MVEVRLVAGALDLELGHERSQLAGAVRHHGNRPLGREELEAREVADVVLAEEHVAGESKPARVLGEHVSSRTQLVCRDPGRRSHGARFSR